MYFVPQVCPSKTGSTASMKAHLKNKYQVDNPQKNVISHDAIMKYLAQGDSCTTMEEVITNMVAKGLLSPYQIECSKVI
ncbi:MAG: hypothetical protein MHPSP_004646 [Paramarteilia canceri]